MKIDLHIHTTASDGKLSPVEIIDLAIKNKVDAVAITDHDNVDGLSEAINYASRRKFEFVPGIEFSANPGELEKELHIVGLFIDPKNLEIIRIVQKQRDYGGKRMALMVQKLNSLGYQITNEELENEAQRKNYGRPIIAQVLMRKYPLEFKERKQVFDLLLGKKGHAFVKNQSSALEEIIKVIHSAGGLAFIAHPGYLQEPEKTIKEFVRLNGDGIEVDCLYESFNDKAKELKERFRKIAEKEGLLISGGTDFHQDEGSNMIGNAGITKEEFEKIKHYLLSRRKYSR